MTFKLSTLAKFDRSRVKKNVLQKIFTSGQEEMVTRGEKSFNQDGYKVVRILAFGDITNYLAKRMAIVGLVVALVDLKALDPDKQG